MPDGCGHMVERVRKDRGVAESGQAIGGTAASDAETGRDADELRDAMVDRIVAELGEELPEAVVAALRTVPRHLFTPGVPLARAYEDISIVTKADERGTCGWSLIRTCAGLRSARTLLTGA
jgi:hypothetical protein